MKFGLQEQAVQQIQQILRSYPQIEKAQIFGSRAIGNYRPNSDIDIVLWGQLDEFLLVKILDELEQLPLPYLFDVKDYATITHAGLQAHIKQCAKDLL